MKQSITLIIVAVLIVGIAQASVWFYGSYEDVKIKAQEENKNILIDFSSDY